jgi:hypothetical protein
MACCGQTRSQLSLAGQVASAANRVVASPSPTVVFQYTGQTGMTVVGSGTERTYRFSAPGSRVQIDARDVRSLAGVPNLSRV